MVENPYLKRMFPDMTDRTWDAKTQAESYDGYKDWLKSVGERDQFESLNEYIAGYHEKSLNRQAAIDGSMRFHPNGTIDFGPGFKERALDSIGNYAGSALSGVLLGGVAGGAWRGWPSSVAARSGDAWDLLRQFRGDIPSVPPTNANTNVTMHNKLPTPTPGTGVHGVTNQAALEAGRRLTEAGGPPGSPVKVPAYLHQRYQPPSSDLMRRLTSGQRIGRAGLAAGKGSILGAVALPLLQWLLPASDAEVPNLEGMTQPPGEQWGGGGPIWLPPTSDIYPPVTPSPNSPNLLTP